MQKLLLNLWNECRSNGGNYAKTDLTKLLGKY